LPAQGRKVGAEKGPSDLATAEVGNIRFRISSRGGEAP